jgi:FdhD protein
MKMQSAIETFSGQCWDGDRVSETRDVIANETALALVYNGRPYVVMMVTPQDVEDFVLGFSLSEGIIREAREFFKVNVRAVADGIEANVEIAEDRFRELDRKQRNLTGRLGCGLCGAQTLAQAVRHPESVAKNLAMSPLLLQKAMAELAASQTLNKKTGAVHAAAWISGAGEIMFAREDVGRHNALDKLIGALVRAKTDASGGAAVITSRASYEMIQKSATLGIQMVCAISAPTALAIKLAEETGVTLVAFARGKRLTVYTHPRRIALEKEIVTA